MIVVMKAGSTEDHLKVVIDKIEGLGFKPHLSRGEKKTIVGVVGNGKAIDHEQFTMLDGVDSVVRIMKPYKLAGREFKQDPTIVEVGKVKVGGDKVVVMAGPCAVESREQMLGAADAVAAAGATILRGGAFKPRSSPYSFQGLGEEGLQILSAAKQKTGLPVVTEVTTPTVVEVGRVVRRYATDRGSQHAEFRAARGGWSGRQTGAVETGDDVDRRGTTNVGGIYPVQRQSECYFVRARYPHF